MFNDKFISLTRLAGHFDLPTAYLKRLADKGSLPFLVVNGHRRFNPLAVEKALSELAKKAGEKTTSKRGGNEQ
jgi:hypothetical protein